MIVKVEDVIVFVFEEQIPELLQVDLICRYKSRVNIELLDIDIIPELIFTGVLVDE